MKNYMLSFCLLLVGSTLFGQNIIEEKFQHLYEHEKATVVDVTGKMFSYAVHFEDTSDEEVNEIAKLAASIDNMSLVAMKEWENAGAEYKKALSYIDGDLEELIRVRSEDGNFSLYIDESDDIVRELVGIGKESDNFVVFSITGEMDLNKIGKLASKIQMEGLNKIEAIDTYDVSAVKVFPNPAKGSGNVTLELPSEWNDANATLFNESGTKIKDYRVNAGSQELSYDNLSPGIYYLDIEKESVNVKKKIIVVE